jgi:hypothetical protein
VKRKERLGDALLILLFLGILAGCAYAIIRIMTKWTIKGLG